jgi:CRISPR/Cas system-associated endonuclease Cas1
LNLEPEKLEQGLAKLVLSLIELIRQLLERQAIRRMEAGSLSSEEMERLGTTLMKLEKRVQELKEHFGVDDLNLDLGPLGKLID